MAVLLPYTALRAGLIFALGVASYASARNIVDVGLAERFVGCCKGA